MDIHNIEQKNKQIEEDKKAVIARKEDVDSQVQSAVDKFF